MTKQCLSYHFSGEGTLSLLFFTLSSPVPSSMVYCVFDALVHLCLVLSGGNSIESGGCCLEVCLWHIR